MDTSETLRGKQGCASADAAENSQGFPGDRAKRRRAGDLHVAFVANEEHAQRSAPKVDLPDGGQRNAQRRTAQRNMTERST